MHKNIVMGYSGHAYVVVETSLKAGIGIHYYACHKAAESNPFELTYIGDERDEQFKGWGNGYGFILGIGDNETRVNVARRVEEYGEKLLSVVHPSAYVSDYAILGKGTFIAGGAYVNPMAGVGNYVILNTGSIVEHECEISDGVHIAPGAVLAGNVKVGQRTFVGANSVIKEGVTIGEDVIIGAGSTILKDIPNGKMFVGNPGKEVKGSGKISRFNE